MKKIIIISIVLALLLVGCSTGAVKTGLGVSTKISSSKDAATDDDGNPVDGRAQVDSAMAAVTVDANGKIVGVQIDSTQTRVSFDATGIVTADKSAKVKTKVELGDDYGLIKASGIGREWYEQIGSLSEWMVGKTIDEVNAMKTYERDDSHPMVPDETDLTSSVTIDVSVYLEAVTKAVANAK